MKQKPFMSGIVYIILGVLFVYFAIKNVNENGGWGIFSLLLVIFATFDIGSGIRLVLFNKKQK